jgi:hypothetical protein
MDVTLSSLDRLMTVTSGALCYGHFGMRTDGPDLLARHRRQLLLWQDILSAEVQKEGIISEAGTEACVDLMLANDPNLVGFRQLPPEVQQRERGFLRNSIKGFIGYLASR